MYCDTTASNKVLINRLRGLGRDLFWCGVDQNTILVVQAENWVGGLILSFGDEYNFFVIVVWCGFEFQSLFEFVPCKIRASMLSLSDAPLLTLSLMF